jgi:transposase
VSPIHIGEVQRRSVRRASQHGRPDPPKEDPWASLAVIGSSARNRRPSWCSRPCAAPKTIAQLCREHDISESLLRKWREQFLAAGAERLSGKAERTEADELRRQVSRLERALGRKTMEVEVAGELLRGWE